MKIFAVASFLGGCSVVIPRSYADPKEVGLPEAMTSVSCGLATLRNENSRLGLNTAMIVDTVEVTLQVKASASGVSGLVVSNLPLGTGGLGYNDTTTTIGERGSTVKIILKSLHTAELNESGARAAISANKQFDLGPGVIASQPDPCNLEPFTKEQISKSIIVRNTP